MFTGIIEEKGMISRIMKTASQAILTIKAKKVMEDIHIGDSIAVNGICLTVTSFSANEFQADVMHETLDRTSLKMLKPGSSVNLERAMAAGGRFGGHMVSGHIDGTGRITDIKEDSLAIWYTIETSPEILHYIVEKGSIAIDGISLTVAKVTQTTLQFPRFHIHGSLLHWENEEQEIWLIWKTISLENMWKSLYMRKNTHEIMKESSEKKNSWNNQRENWRSTDIEQLNSNANIFWF